MSLTPRSHRSGALRRTHAGSTRVVVLVALAVIVAAGIYVAAGDGDVAPPRPRQPLSVIDPVRARAEIPDLGPITALRERGGDGGAFDRAALDHVLRVVESGTLPERSGEEKPLEAASALETKADAGCLVETVGVVKRLEREEFRSAASPAWDQLWSFGLVPDASDAGAPRVVVIDPGDSKSLGGGAPVSAHDAGTAGTPLKVDDRVRVRGVFLQRRTGALGAGSLAAPTPVLVGRDYRITGPVTPPPTELKDVAFGKVNDRFGEGTYDVADEAHWQCLAWARARGAVAIAKDLASGAIPVMPWGSPQFLKWKGELESDHGDASTPDPRVWTNARRGRVFALMGELVEVVSEDWAQVPANAYDVDRRHVYWIFSDSYANAGIPLYSSFGLECFPTIPPPVRGRERATKVRAFGVFVHNLTYTRGASKQEITVPSFQLLTIERR